MREKKRIEDAIATDAELVRRQGDIAAYLELAHEGEKVDADLQREIGALQQLVDRLETKTLLSGDNDALNAIVTIHAGAGGVDSQDWADMLLRMYLRWAERQGFQTVLYDYQPAEEAGIKSATFGVNGQYAFGLLTSEIGVHRLVRISPFDQAKRRHTSFASVFVSPEIDDSIDVVIKPEDLQSKIEASDADLSAYFEKNKGRYNVPERRIVQYAFLDLEQLRLHANISQDQIRAYYNDHIDRYKQPDRAHVAHILFKTVGKTDAESEEIRKKAEDVLKKAKSGANFGELAKQYSEDTSKDKGGDLDWIVRGQTVPEFEQAAFTLPIGSVSDLVKTQYGFHIVKVLDRQAARTQTLDEVFPQILGTLQEDQAQRAAEDLSGQISAEIRRSGRVSIDDLAKKFNLKLGQTPPLEANQPIPDVGNSPELAETVFRLRPGDDSSPIHTDKGYVVISVKEDQPAHPAALSEVHDRVLADYRHEKATDLAKTRAEELAKRAKSGEDLTKAAKAIGLEAKTSDLFSRTGSVSDLGGAAQLGPAFGLSAGQTSDAVSLGANWAVYKVLDRQDANPADMAKQQQDVQQQLLDARRTMAFEAFRKSLDNSMRQGGKLKMNAENLRRITTPSSS